MNKTLLVILSSMLVLSACGGSDKVKTEEYQFADGIKLLDLPPNLTSPNKNLVMEIPKPSQIACEKLMNANAKFELQKAQKEKAKKAEKAADTSKTEKE